jgi:hypothetical protein
MRQLTVADIRSLGPCYDPTKFVKEDWAGTVLDILKLEGPSGADKLWVVTRYLSDKTNRLFAVWCAREALKLVKDADPRSVAACDVAERFAYGNATAEELAAAWAAAWAAASDAAAWAAAWAAASDAAAWAAARAAAWDAAWAAAWAAASDAAAWAAARDAQLKRLCEMIEEYEP